jgi:membrane protein implicated in regulation of membrane protease activity
VLHAQLAQAAVSISAQKRNRFFLPTFCIVMGAAFIFFASDGGLVLNIGTVAGAALVVFGLVLIVLAQRYARDLERNAQQATAAGPSKTDGG